MNWSDSTIDSLRRVFAEGFLVRDVAEPLVSFDAGASGAEVVALMRERRFDVVGVRRDGLVEAYAEQADLTQEACAAQARPIDEALLVADSAPLSEAVRGLSQSPRLFVRSLGAVSGIVTRDDLEKPSVRMWLFGMITIIEMRFTRLVEVGCAEDDWRQYLSASRLEKASELLALRRKAGQDPSLLDCLQFSDKGQIIARKAALRSFTRFASRREVEKAVRALESLRNSLAHSQSLTAHDWPAIVVLAELWDSVLMQAKRVEGLLQGRAV